MIHKSFIGHPFIQTFNYLMASFRYCDPKTKYRRCKTLCMSLYGCIMWGMSDQYIEEIFVTLKKCLPKLLDVPQTTHSSSLHLIFEDIPVNVQIHIHCVKFFKSVISSENTIVKLCSKLALNGSGSTICKNINYIWFKYSLKYSNYDTAIYVITMNNMKSQCGKLSTYDYV